MDHDDWLLERQPWKHRASRRESKHASRKPYERDEPTRIPRDTPTAAGVVLHVTRDAAEVRMADGGVLDCRLPPDLRAADRTGPAVGDDATVALTELPTVVRLGPRRTTLSRRDPANPHLQRVVVANVDWVGIVAAATEPPLRPGLIDRYLLAVHHGGAEPVIVVNKVDEADEADRAWVDATVLPWERAGIAVIRASATTGEGLDRLLEVLGTGRGAFVGHSGVGKSSLVRALGGPEAEVGGLAEHGRGRHTTTGSTLHELPGGARVIDTPGVRQFAPWSPTKADLEATFADLVAIARRCGFSGCTHTHEVDCAVLDAIDAGELSAHRLQSFVRLADEVR